MNENSFAGIERFIPVATTLFALIISFVTLFYERRRVKNESILADAEKRRVENEKTATEIAMETGASNVAGRLVEVSMSLVESMEKRITKLENERNDDKKRITILEKQTKEQEMKIKEQAKKIFELAGAIKTLGEQLLDKNIKPEVDIDELIDGIEIF